MGKGREKGEEEREKWEEKFNKKTVGAGQNMSLTTNIHP